MTISAKVYERVCASEFVFEAMYVYMWLWVCVLTHRCQNSHTQVKHVVVCLLTDREQVLRDDDAHVVHDEAVPERQARVGLLGQQLCAEQQEEKAGHQVAQAEHADARGPRHKHHRQHEPEHVAEHQHLGHVQVTPGEEDLISICLVIMKK